MANLLNLSRREVGTALLIAAGSGLQPQFGLSAPKVLLKLFLFFLFTVIYLNLSVFYERAFKRAQFPCSVCVSPSVCYLRRSKYFLLGQQISEAETHLH